MKKNYITLAVVLLLLASTTLHLAYQLATRKKMNQEYKHTRQKAEDERKSFLENDKKDFAKKLITAEEAKASGLAKTRREEEFAGRQSWDQAFAKSRLEKYLAEAKTKAQNPDLDKTKFLQELAENVGPKGSKAVVTQSKTSYAVGVAYPYSSLTKKIPNADLDEVMVEIRKASAMIIKDLFTVAGDFPLSSVAASCQKIISVEGRQEPVVFFEASVSLPKEGQVMDWNPIGVTDVEKIWKVSRDELMRITQPRKGR